MNDTGHLYRNGHGRCGCCGYVADRVHGGRRERKREGWRYEPTTLGWVCGGCAALLTWPDDPRRCGKPGRNVEKPPHDVDNSGPRGFGAERPETDLQRLKARKRKVTRRERRKLRKAQDRAQLSGKQGARVNRPKDLHTKLEPRRRRPPIRTLRNGSSDTS